MNRKETMAFLRLAERNGARVVHGKKHVKVFAADGRYLLSLSHGMNASGSREDGATRIAKQEGWI